MKKLYAWLATSLAIGGTFSSPFFLLEHFLLKPDSPAIAADPAVGTDHPMARNKVCHRILADGRSNGAPRCRFTNGGSNLTV